MITYTNRTFDKAYAKLPKRLQQRFKDRRNIFLLNPFDPILDNHPLHPPYTGCRSINITGDYRAIFYHEATGAVRFILIGTHHELFGT